MTAGSGIYGELSMGMHIHFFRRDRAAVPRVTFAPRGMFAVSAVVPGAAVMAGAAPGVSSGAVVFGVWGTARELPGLAGVEQAEIESLSCTAPGDCAAGGFYVT